jgi:hypothetical protein
MWSLPCGRWLCVWAIRNIVSFVLNRVISLLNVPEQCLSGRRSLSLKD